MLHVIHITVALIIYWRRIEVVITRTTRNRFVLTGTWVRIPPSPLTETLEFTGLTNLTSQIDHNII